jgi:pyruvate dehydrogenase E2 component (dihydrolipoamide acetyltransferase)
MAVDVTMPRLSDSMEEGTVLRWMKSVGDEVKRGDELVEIETDKANMTYEATDEGVLLEILAEEGSTLPIGEPIARIGEAGEASSNGAPKREQPKQEEKPPEPEPARAPAATQERAAPSPSADGDGRVKASPVARRMARELNVELDQVQGSGPGGRIVKADVEAATTSGAVTPATDGAPAPQAAPAETAAPAAPAEPAEPQAAPPAPAPAVVAEAGTAKGEVSIQELTRTQQVIARRMAESKATVPEFTISTDVDMEGAVELRSQLKAATENTGGVVPSYNDMVVKASAIALREFPRANGSYKDGHFELYSRVNIGVAVAAQDALVVPTVFDADRKSLGEIARDSRALAERVRAGVVTPPELSGGTFTVSNLGMFGVTEFVAVINPPQAAILAVGKMEPRAVVRDGEIIARNTMSITLACDHRILYGADAAEFLARIRALLEQPIALAL